MGRRFFWRILCQYFWLYLPVIGVITAVGLMVLVSLATGTLAMVGAAVFLIWYLPCFELALAGLAGELFSPGKWGERETGPGTELGREWEGFSRWVTMESRREEKTVRAMKLREKGGWYYCVMGKGPAHGGCPAKRADALFSLKADGHPDE